MHFKQHTRAILSKTSVNKEETIIAAEKTERTETDNKNDANDKFSNRRLNTRKEDRRTRIRIKDIFKSQIHSDM